MLKVLLTILFAAIAGEQQNDPADQILNFKQNTVGPIGIMTTSAGAPVEYKDARVTLNSKLLFNEYFMDFLTHIVREKIPDRIVHAKAGGAFGYFETTHDVSHICKAKLFNGIGKKTPVAARFSPVVIEKGGIDTSRESRGFSIKFYTEDGNFDIVGVNTPMYFYKDPLLFASFARAMKRNPATNLVDENTMWDILTLQPESLHTFLLIFGDRGIPDGYRHMPGFGIHTFEVVNVHGEKSFIRFHFYPDAGIKNLRSQEARNIAANDPDYAIRDLYAAIANEKFPCWTVSVQILSLEDVTKAGFDVFDVTKVLPLDRYPLHTLGRLVLNKNPKNYFADIEQLAFSPGNLVPGILGGPDKLFEARRLAYRDAQYYRLGANFNKIAVNCPVHSQILTYNRDGVPPVKDNGGDTPIYYPNSFNGPVAYLDENRPSLLEIYQDEPNNFEQAANLYTNEMTSEERDRLIENIINSLNPVADFLKDRATKIFNIIHHDLGTRVAEGLSANISKNY